MLLVTTFDFVWNSVLCIDDNWGFQTELSDVSSPGSVGHLIVRTLALRKSTHGGTQRLIHRSAHSLHADSQPKQVSQTVMGVLMGK